MNKTQRINNENIQAISKLSKLGLLQLQCQINDGIDKAYKNKAITFNEQIFEDNLKALIENRELANFTYEYETA